MKQYRDTIKKEIITALDAVKTEEMEQAVREIRQAGRVFCDGFGRSSHSMRGMAMRLEQMGLPSALVGEATAPAFAAGDLLLICSASGSSPVLHYHAEQAKKYGGRMFLITGRTDSPLSELADGLLLIEAQSKDHTGEGSSSIQPMGALFEQVSQILCDTLVLELMEELRITEKMMRERHANIE